MQKRVCYVCKIETKDLCKRCKSIYYCSKSCQKSHWNKHKADCFDREKLESQLQEYDNTSKELYAICANECEGLPNPTLWIYNQNKMREMWEKWNQHLQNKHPLLKFAFESPCNSYKVYMYYMYNTYPVGFGEYLKNAYTNSHEGEMIDGCRIFNELSKK